MPNPIAEARDLVNQVAPPVGSIVAWLPRGFTGAGNTGVDSTDRIDLGACWEHADGGLLPSDSPLINGSYLYKPDLSDSRFTMGDTSPGTTGGINDSTHTHSYKHYHTFSFSGSTSGVGDHAHLAWFFPPSQSNTFESEPGPSASQNENQIPYGTGGAGSHSHSVSGSGNATDGGGAEMNNSSDPATGDPTMIENRPKFISVYYIVRVK